ncbi:MAG: DUF2781 domain-containing protein [Myxococcales bacterium]|nr:DUF2781 domain-containing protein [Myxococcales bacterium]MCB9522605.1 DUF2781 domain-containing protein [Myxococcales bacterium]
MVCLAGFALGWLTYDVPYALGVRLPVLTWYETAIDPYSAHLPYHLRLAIMAAAFLYGPFYVVALWGMWRRAAWVGPLALPISGALVATTTLSMAASLSSDTPPLNLGVFLGFNGPYVVVPLALIYRFTVAARTTG